MHFLRLLCAGLAFSAMAAEIPVNPLAAPGEAPAAAAAPMDQYDVVVAWNGDQYLAVWSDERAGVRQTYAARVSRDGTVLDPNGFRIASAALNSYRVGSDTFESPLYVIWGGDSWFVLSNPCGGISRVRVAADGTVLDPIPRYSASGSACTAISVASDGQHVVVGYAGGHQTYEKRALFLGSDGSPVSDVQLSSGDTDLQLPAITSTGSSFVAVWKDHAVRFDRDGILDSSAKVSFDDRVNASTHIASDGTDMLVVRNNLAFRLSADLVAEPLGELPFSFVRSVTWTGSGYVVSGVVSKFENGNRHFRNVNIVRLDDDGRLLSRQEMPARGTEGAGGHLARGASVATNGENVLVAWHDPNEAQRALWSPESDAFFSVLSLPDLTPGPRRLLSVTAEVQIRPVTASSGRQSLTIWEERSGIYARRHRRDGRPDGPPIQLTADATSMDVVFNGSDFIVATTEGMVVTRRLPATGELRVLDESRFEPGKVGPVALANSGGVTLATWLDGGVRAVRLAADGSPATGRPLDVAPDPSARLAHRVAISPNDAGEFLIVWGGSTPECFCSPSATSESGRLHAARVTSALTLLDRFPIEIARPVAAADPGADPNDPRYDPAHSLKADHPSAAWNGSEWLVVWNRGVREAAGVREEIRGRRIARNGTLLDGFANDPGVLIARDGFAPTVAWTGARYVLAWYAGLSTYRVAGRQGHDLHQIRTALFDTLGGPLSNERMLGQSPAEDPVSIAAVVNEFTILAYSRLADANLYGGVSRAFLDVPAPDPRRRSVRK